MVDAERVTLRLGAGVSVHDSQLGLARDTELDDEVELRTVEDTEILALLYLGVEARLSPKLTFFVEADLSAESDPDFSDGTAQFRYHVSPRWDVSLGYRRYQRDLQEEEALLSLLTREGVVTSVAYRF